ncbi:hypothetical protein GCM10027589_59110 [Actinocorallia lasiicapitis]
MPEFDGWARSYDDSQLQQALYRPVHREIVGWLRAAGRSPARILDAGCGTARLTADLAGAFPRSGVLGVDACPPMLAAAASFVQVAAARVERLPFRSASFDLVVSSLSFRHWTDRRAGLAEIARVLTPEGTLLLADALPEPDRAALRTELPGELALTALTPLRTASLLADTYLAVAHKTAPPPLPAQGPPRPAIGTQFHVIP